MLTRFASLLALAVFAAAAAPARAEPVPAVPQFATLDRVDGTSRFSADGSLSLWDDDFGDIFGLGLQLHGQYVAPMGAGGYLTLPLSYGSLHVDVPVLDDVDEDEFSIGNVELGGLYAVPPTGPISLVLRAGLSLPTATDDADNLASPNLYTAFARITDIVLFPEDTSTLRLSASALGDFGQLVFRADGGIDIPFADDDDADVAFNDEDPLLRLNLGGGVKLASAALMAELATLITTGDVDEDNDGDDDQDRAIHTFAITARLLSDGAQPMLSVVLPLDDGLDDLIDVMILFGITAEIDTEGR